MDHDRGLEARAARHAALGDPVRLAIVDDLMASDRAPVELCHRLGIESNLLAHHLDVLERVGFDARLANTVAVLERAAAEHPGKVVQATSLGAEDMVLTDLIARHDLPIADVIAGNLCRCTGYVNIVAAVKTAALQINAGASQGARS